MVRNGCKQPGTCPCWRVYLSRRGVPSEGTPLHARARPLDPMAGERTADVRRTSRSGTRSNARVRRNTRLFRFRLQQVLRWSGCCYQSEGLASYRSIAEIPPSGLVPELQLSPRKPTIFALLRRWSAGCHQPTMFQTAPTKSASSPRGVGGLDAWRRAARRCSLGLSCRIARAIATMADLTSRPLRRPRGLAL
jgi:hypothetical protein